MVPFALLHSVRLGPSRRWLLILWLLGSCLAGPAYGQPYHFERKGARRVTTHFELQRNLIVLTAMLNGKGPYNFLLDTGVSTSLITDPSLQQELNLRVGTAFQVSGAGADEAPLQAYRTDSVRVELPGIVSVNSLFLVLSEDVLNLSGYVGMPIHGILGADLFYSFAIVIHPGESSITFHDPERYKPPRSQRWARLPLVLEANKAYFTTEVVMNDSLRLPVKLILDTGAGHALSLEVSSDSRLQLPPTRLRTQLGRGLNGFINGYLGRVPTLQLGRYRLSSLITSFPDASDVAMRADVPRNGNIGFEILKRFDIVIDYRHNVLMLRPNVLFRDPFEQDMCGFELLATGMDFRRYLIAKVQPGSPADLAGIRPEEEIVSINQLPSGIFTLTQVSRIFHSGDGRLVQLFMRRTDGTVYTTMVRLKRQI